MTDASGQGEVLQRERKADGTAPARMRRYRARLRGTLMAVRIDVDYDLIAALVDAGFLHRNDEDDQVKVATAVTEMHRALLLQHDRHPFDRR